MIDRRIKRQSPQEKLPASNPGCTVYLFVLNCPSTAEEDGRPRVGQWAYCRLTCTPSPRRFTTEEIFAVAAGESFSISPGKPGNPGNSEVAGGGVRGSVVSDIPRCLNESSLVLVYFACHVR